jgi:hypothetical protein
MRVSKDRTRGVRRKPAAEEEPHDVDERVGPPLRRRPSRLALHIRRLRQPQSNLGQHACFGVESGGELAAPVEHL